MASAPDRFKRKDGEQQCRQKAKEKPEHPHGVEDIPPLLRSKTDAGKTVSVRSRLDILGLPSAEPRRAAGRRSGDLENSCGLLMCACCRTPALIIEHECHHHVHLI